MNFSNYKKYFNKKLLLYNNKNHLKSMNCCCGFDELCYLSNCEILEAYLKDPYSIFCGTVIPAKGVSPILPTPPVSPIPPVLDNGVFRSMGLINDRTFYHFDTISINGNTIKNVNGSEEITLAPNRSYFFSLTSENEINVDPFEVGVTLLQGGAPVPGGTARTNMLTGVHVAVISANGVINTRNNSEVLQLEFISTVGSVRSRIDLSIQLID